MKPPAAAVRAVRTQPDWENRLWVVPDAVGVREIRISRMCLSFWDFQHVEAIVL